jgi:hypothetical protein
MIKVHPVDSIADPHTAVILNGLIRNIEATSRAGQAYDIGLASAVDGGWGYWRVNTNYAYADSFDLDVVIEAVPNPLAIWGDPYSSKADSSDWNIAFAGEMVPDATFEKKWKGADKVDWESGPYVGLGDPWREGKQVFVCERWTREEIAKEILLLSDGSVVGADVFKTQQEFFARNGLTVVTSRQAPGYKVRQTILTGAEVLEKRDWPGSYIPIIPCYGEEANIEGKRYFRSLIRSARDAQQKYNVWDSAATELAAQAPKNGWIGPKGSFVTDAAKWATCNTQAWAYIEYDPVSGMPPPQRPQTDFAGAAAALQQAGAAAGDIKAITGIHDAGLGSMPEDQQSGKALMQLQRRGDIATFDYTDNQSRAIEHTGCVVVDLIPHVYSGERVIRILGPSGERLPPVPLGKETPVIDAKGRPVRDQNGNALTKIYDLSVGKYDVTVEAGPNFATARQETLDALTTLIQAVPQAAGVLGDVVVKLLDIQDADEVGERLRAMLPPEIKGDDPRVQQLQQAMEQMKQQGLQQIQQLQDEVRQATSAIQDMQVRLDAEKARTQIEQGKLTVAQFEAETDRLKALKDVAQIVGAPLVAEIIAQTMNTPDIAPGAQPGMSGLAA